jgi:hypothetical protein
MSGRVTHIRCFNVSGQEVAQLGETADNFNCALFSALLAIACVTLFSNRATKAQTSLNLLRKQQQ